MERAKVLSVIILTVAVIFFAGQNLDSVEVTFLFWHFYVPLSLITLVPLLVGLVVGWVGTAVVIRHRKLQAQAAGSEAGAEPEQLKASPPEAGTEAAFKDAEEIPK
jgi:uncharacterized integral membrane protein